MIPCTYSKPPSDPFPVHFIASLSKLSPCQTCIQQCKLNYQLPTIASPAYQLAAATAGANAARLHQPLRQRDRSALHQHPHTAAAPVQPAVTGGGAALLLPSDPTPVSRLDSGAAGHATGARRAAGVDRMPPHVAALTQRIVWLVVGAWWVFRPCLVGARPDIAIFKGFV